MTVRKDSSKDVPHEQVLNVRSSGNRCSRSFVTFVIPTILKGLRGQAIDVSTLPMQPQDVCASAVRARAVQIWKDAGDKATMTRLIRTLFAFKLLSGSLFSSFIGISYAALRPLALKKLIESAKNDNSLQEAHLWLVCLLVLLLAEGFSMVNCKMIFQGEIAAGFRCSIGALIQMKAIALAPGVVGTSSAQGLLGNDVSKNYENFQWFAQGPFIFLSVVAGFATLMVTLGYTGLIAISLTMICFVATCGSTIPTKRAEHSALLGADKRLSILLRVIEGIKAVKFNAWESRFLDRITQARAAECAHIRRFRWLQELGKQIGRGAPVLIPCVCFIFLALVGVELDSANVFPALFVFESMRSAFVTLPLMLININNWLVSSNRIDRFLRLPEVTPPEPMAENSDAAMELTSARFEWSSAQNHDGQAPMVTAFGGSGGITVRILRGEAVGLVGQVGSGKSSFLTALLGDLRLSDGAISVDRSIGYAPQRAFIVSGTVRYNVVLGRPWDEKHFSKAVFAACLVRDLEDLPGGADTEIGERGVTLSGGQQQRISVARALYGCPRLLLLDDPLAAVDPAVARDMFERIVRNRHEWMTSQIPMTVVMALNQPQFIQHFDRILQFEDSAVRMQGTWEECADALKSVNGFIVGEENMDKNESRKIDDRQVGEQEREPVTRPSVAHVGSMGASLIAKENASTAETFKTIQQYGRSMGWYGAAFLLFSFAAYAVFGATGLILTNWVDAAESARANGRDFGSANAQYCTIFAATCLLHAILAILGGIFSALATVGSSEELHNDCTARVLHAPVAWFDATPSGRLTSRFSTDCALVDTQLSLITEVLVSFSCTLMALAAIVCIVVPATAPILILCAGIYGWLVRGVDRSNRTVRRCANMANGPVLGILGEIGYSRGQTVVRAMGLGPHYAERFDKAIDAQSKLLYNSAGIVMWSTGFSYILGTIIAGSTVALMLNVGEHSGGDLGLAVTYAFAINFFMQLMSVMVTQFLTMLTALERLLQCLKEVPQEPPWESVDDKALPAAWPIQGSVEFRKASLVYRSGLPPALNEVSLIVPAGTSAGVVGRTGSGKSSLLVLLFRIAEAAAGQVLVDGVNISSLGLHTLRKAMAIIPQEPLLLEGTVRTNVDPFGEKDDAEVVRACSRVGLFGENILEVPVGAVNSELSAGQKQLVSLARTLLQHAKIIAFDEPTSNIDPSTDEKVQQTMRVEFAGSTTLTIAHRLETILNCDQVIVMDAGKVKESGPPQKLLSDPSSAFAEMARRHGGISMTIDSI